jgi:hypothetical protein
MSDEFDLGWLADMLGETSMSREARDAHLEAIEYAIRTGSAYSWHRELVAFTRMTNNFTEPPTSIVTLFVVAIDQSSGNDGFVWFRDRALAIEWMTRFVTDYGHEHTVTWIEYATGNRDDFALTVELAALYGEHFNNVN